VFYFWDILTKILLAFFETLGKIAQQKEALKEMTFIGSKKKYKKNLGKE